MVEIGSLTLRDLFCNRIEHFDSCDTLDILAFVNQEKFPFKDKIMEIISVNATDKKKLFDSPLSFWGFNDSQIMILFEHEGERTMQDMIFWIKSLLLSEDLSNKLRFYLDCMTDKELYELTLRDVLKNSYYFVESYSDVQILQRKFQQMNRSEPFRLKRSTTRAETTSTTTRTTKLLKDMDRNELILWIKTFQWSLRFKQDVIHFLFTNKINGEILDEMSEIQLQEMISEDISCQLWTKQEKQMFISEINQKKVQSKVSLEKVDKLVYNIELGYMHLQLPIFKSLNIELTSILERSLNSCLFHLASGQRLVGTSQEKIPVLIQLLENKEQSSSLVITNKIQIFKDIYPETLSTICTTSDMKSGIKSSAITDDVTIIISPMPIVIQKPQGRLAFQTLMDYKFESPIHCLKACKNIIKQVALLHEKGWAMNNLTPFSFVLINPEENNIWNLNGDFSCATQCISSSSIMSSAAFLEDTMKDSIPAKQPIYFDILNVLHAKFSAPEYNRQEKEQRIMRGSQSADLFSLGLILYRITTGRDIFSSNQVAIHQTSDHDWKVSTTQLEYLETYNSYCPNFSLLVEQLLRLNPEHRPSAQEVYDLIRV